MIRIGILGDIGSGKSFIAKNFGYPVFNADHEVSQLYVKDKRIFKKLSKVLPNYFLNFPIKKKDVIKAILSSQSNLKKILKIVHPEIRKKLNFFLTKHKKKKFVILDIPLLLENKLVKKKDLLIFVKSNKKEILKRLRKRETFNKKLYKNFKSIQLSLDFKKNKADFLILNNFSKKSVKIQISKILKIINNERNNS